jgi:hypothetical protein
MADAHLLVLSYLESTNLNFAALQLNAGLGFAPQVLVDQLQHVDQLVVVHQQ